MVTRLFGGASHAGTGDSRSRDRRAPGEGVLSADVWPLALVGQGEGPAADQRSPGDGYDQRHVPLGVRLGPNEVENLSYVHAPGDELLLAAGLLAFHRDSARREHGQDAGTAFLKTGTAPAPARHEGCQKA